MIMLMTLILSLSIVFVSFPYIKDRKKICKIIGKQRDLSLIISIRNSVIL